jgi:hypothetical protein
MSNASGNVVIPPVPGGSPPLARKLGIFAVSDGVFSVTLNSGGSDNMPMLS